MATTQQVCMNTIHSRNRRERLKAEHRCCQCASPIPPDITTALCPNCSQQARERSKQRYAKIKKLHSELNLCINCLTNQAEKGKLRCKTCSEINAIECKALRQKKAKLHLCRNCGIPLSQNHNTTLCDTCSEKCNEKCSNKKNQRKAHHQCLQCGQPLPENYTKRKCPDCNAKYSAQQKAKRAEKRRKENNQNAIQKST